MSIENLNAFGNEVVGGATDTRSLQEFEELVKSATNSKRHYSKEWSSMGTTVYEVSCLHEYKFFITRALFNMLDLDRVKQTIENFVCHNTKQDEDNDDEVYYCFVDAEYNFSDIAELNYRLLALYLEPTYCQSAGVSFDYYNKRFRVDVNGCDAYFYMHDLKSGLWDTKLVHAFRVFVSATHETDKILFDSKDRKIKEL